jgi:hypothetical protein
MATSADSSVPLLNVREQMAGALDLIIQISRLADGSRKITHVTKVQRLEREAIQVQIYSRLRRGRAAAMGLSRGVSPRQARSQRFCPSSASAVSICRPICSGLLSANYRKPFGVWTKDEGRTTTLAFVIRPSSFVAKGGSNLGRPALRLLCYISSAKRTRRCTMGATWAQLCVEPARLSNVSKLVRVYSISIACSIASGAGRPVGSARR